MNRSSDSGGLNQGGPSDQASNPASAAGLPKTRGRFGRVVGVTAFFGCLIALGMVGATALIAVMIRLVLKGARATAVQAATGFFYLAVITALTAELAAKVRFLPPR